MQTQVNVVVWTNEFTTVCAIFLSFETECLQSKKTFQSVNKQATTRHFVSWACEHFVVFIFGINRPLDKHVQLSENWFYVTWIFSWKITLKMKSNSARTYILNFSWKKKQKYSASDLVEICDETKVADNKYQYHSCSHINTYFCYLGDLGEFWNCLYCTRLWNGWFSGEW